MFKHINIKIWPWVVSLAGDFQQKRERERERVLIKESESDKSVPNGWHMFSFQTPHT